MDTLNFNAFTKKKFKAPLEKYTGAGEKKRL